MQFVELCRNDISNISSKNQWLCKTITNKEEEELRSWMTPRLRRMGFLAGYLFLAPIVCCVVVATQIAYDW